LNCDHSACRNSPGRTKNIGASLSAQSTVNVPENPSNARSISPDLTGSVMDAKGFSIGAGIAPIRFETRQRLFVLSSLHNRFSFFHPASGDDFERVGGGDARSALFSFLRSAGIDPRG